MIIDKIMLIATAIVIKNKKTLLLQRGNNSSYSDYWQLPEGKIEEGETLDLALKRELMEEIKVKIKTAKFQTVFYSYITAKGVRYLAIRAVYKTILSSNEIKLSQEHKNYGWYQKQEALGLLLLPGTEEILKNLT